MNPEVLKQIEDEYAVSSTGHAHNVHLLADEVRRLWAERDARQVVGGPVSEEMLARAKRWRHDTSRDQEAAFPPTLGIVDLIDHIAFLERILADADDFPRARRTGYADGWRAGLNAWAELMRHHGTKAGLKTWGDLIKAASELAEEGPP